MGFDATLQKFHVPNRLFSDDLNHTVMDIARKYQRTRGTTDIGPCKYKITIISNKVLPFQFEVQLNDTIKSINSKLQTLIYRKGWSGLCECDDDDTINNLYAPRILALQIKTYIHLTLKYYDKTLKIRKFASENLVNEIVEITENKIILSSLICKHDDYDEIKVIIHGFVRSIVNDIPSDDVLDIMTAYYFIKRNEIKIMKPLEDAMNNIVDNEVLFVYKDTNQQYIEYTDLGNDYFDIFVLTLTGKRLRIKVKTSNTIEDIKRSVFETEGIPVYRMVLIFNRTQLSNERNVIDCHIGPNSTLYLKMTM